MSDNLTDGKLGETAFRVSNAGAQLRLKPWKQAWKYVTLGLRIPDTKARAVQALTEVELANRPHPYPARLLGDEVQHVALAHGLVGEPKLLLLADQLNVWPTERLPNRFVSNNHLPLTLGRQIFSPFMRVDSASALKVTLSEQPQ